jgi:phosphoribosylglycinamide formyltransferase-1
MPHKFPLAVLISGSGSNLQSLIERIQSGLIQARIALVLSNKEEAYGLVRAQREGLPTAVISHGQYQGRQAHDQAVVDTLRKAGARAVILAGYMRLLSPLFIQAFPERILNIHPALLPSFPGLHAQEKAVDHGVRLAGPSVHFVDQDVDHGPIIIQAALPTLGSEGGEVLAQRILKLEHRIYPQAIQWLIQGRLKVQGRRVILEDPPKPGPIEVDGESACLCSPGLEAGF